MRWIKRRLDEQYVDALIRAHLGGEMDHVLDDKARRVVLGARWKAAIFPWLLLFSFLGDLPSAAWRYVYGRYRKPDQKIHGNPAQAPGGSAGAGGFAPHSLQVLPNLAPAPASTRGPFEDAGVRAGEVVAYRCWRLRAGSLYSAYWHSFYWPPGQVIEGDPTRSSEGVHGFKERLDACQYISFIKGISDVIVSGTVELWGDVFEHERGYRASKAAIASIDDSPNYDAAVLRKKYGLDRKPRAGKPK